MFFARHISHWRLAAKIVFLVALMGLISVAITLYATTQMRSIDQRYTHLIANEAQGTLELSDAALLLSESNRIVYAVLTAQEEATMLAELESLKRLQGDFNAKVASVLSLMPDEAAALQAIGRQADVSFAQAHRIVESAARWRGDRALQIIHDEFEPVLRSLQRDMAQLRSRSVTGFQQASQQLGDATRTTVATTLLGVGLGLLSVMALSGWVGVHQISRPITRLTQGMHQLTLRQYDTPVLGTDRRDEVGTMAKAMQVFKDSMQRADRLAIEVAASAEARRLSEQLVDLTSAIPGAVFQLHVKPDGTRRYLYVSDKAADLHSRTAQELLRDEGQIGLEYANAGDTARNQFMDSLATLEPVHFAVQMERGGQAMWLETLATARRTPDEGALFNGVWLDVTQAQLQAHALSKAKEEAERTAEERAEFLAMMSHEIRTPLNAILGLTQLALKDRLDSPQRERIEKMQRAGRHLLGIVDDILDFSKIDGGHMVLEHALFQPRQMVGDVAGMFIDKIDGKGLELQIEVDSDVPTAVFGDSHRMGQILINYVNNAIKFTERGMVSIHLQLANEHSQGLLLRCAVRDTGIGLSPDQEAGLFQAFHQADASITRRFGGTGLGLAISRRLADLMGGAVGVASTPGVGSTFWFTALVQRATPASREHTAHLPQAVPDIAGLSGLRVLVVDDNELNRLVARGLLEAGGMRVDLAEDGADAVDKLQSSPDGTYAAVLMDMQMPIMDGLTATRQLRAQPRFAALPIVAMTANATARDIERSRQAGMNDHLIKPVLESSLWDTLHRWILPGDVQARACDVPATIALQARERYGTDFDPVALEEMRAGLSTADIKALTAKFEQDCTQRLRRLEEAAAVNDWARLRKEAHDLAGTAGSFGLNRLGEVAQTLHSLVSPEAAGGRSLVIALQELRSCAEHGLREMREAIAHGAEL
jgi:signal transduction histidine kinase/FixJ family two-component response regulator/HPt (histidine-containing phosphotransfer) domain-containing protein/HAMP domain-containing protein